MTIQTTMRLHFFVSCLICVQSLYVIRPVFGRSYQRHRVKSGDNLSQLSHRYHISIYKILKMNRLHSKNKIFVGQILKIPIPQKNNYRKNFSDMPNFKSPVHNKKLLLGFSLKGKYRRLGVLWRVRYPYNIRPTSPGKVSKIGYIRGYGKYVMIDHGRGWISFYSNFSKVFVRKGDKVFNSHKIGIAQNKKLFFSISYKGKPLNPTFLLRKRLRKLKTS